MHTHIYIYIYIYVGVFFSANEHRSVFVMDESCRWRRHQSDLCSEDAVIKNNKHILLLKIPSVTLYSHITYTSHMNI